MAPARTQKGPEGSNLPCAFSFPLLHVAGVAMIPKINKFFRPDASLKLGDWNFPSD
jgi:hypothetical protein